MQDVTKVVEREKDDYMELCGQGEKVVHGGTEGARWVRLSILAESDREWQLRRPGR